MVLWAAVPLTARPGVLAVMLTVWAPVVQGSEFNPRESMRHPLLAQTRGWAYIACPWTMGLVSLACISMDAGWEFDYLGWLERRGGLGVAMIGC